MSDEYTPPIELDLVRWLAERDREQREIGWDEGYLIGHFTPSEIEHGKTSCHCAENPYRKG